MRRQVIEADLTWSEGRFAAGLQVAVGEDGRIDRVGLLGHDPNRRLLGRALLPGMVNAHSHAFQRGLRGKAERYPRRDGDFWSWREEMYALARSLDEDAFYALNLQAFSEMRAAGFTTVGEFHYLHHAGDEADFALDRLVLKAAAAAGVRLVLLNAYYRTGGIGQPLQDSQRRFRTPSATDYWRQMDRLAELLDPETQALGVAAHSLRAAPLQELAALHEEARRREMVFHMHVEEQRKEIADAIAAYGQPPLALLNERLGAGEGFTAVHCTHTDPADLESFLGRGGSVCLCPLTEANLGDGVPRLPDAGFEASPWCLGSDSNLRISPCEEMRWLEYAQRLTQERRGILLDADGRVAPALFQAATRGGARALGIEAGAIAPGSWADFVALDLAHPALAGADGEELLPAFVFGAGEEAIAATCVGGRWQAHRPV